MGEEWVAGQEPDKVGGSLDPQVVRSVGEGTEERFFDACEAPPPEWG